MRLEIDQDTSNIIHTLMHSGEYHSPEDVVREAMVSMHKTMVEHAELKAAIQAGITDIDAGNVVDGKKVFQQLREHYGSSC